MPLEPTAHPAATAVESGVLNRVAGCTDVALPELLRQVCEIASDQLRLERTGVWLFVNGDRTLRCVSLFERSKRRHSKGACLSLSNSPAYLQAVASTPLLASEEAQVDPRTAELGEIYLAPNGITSLLDAPLVRDDRLIGMFALEHVGPPREWTDEERRFARSVADIIVARMKSAETSLKATHWQVVVPVSRCVGTGDCDSHAEVDRDLAHDLRNVFSEILANSNLIGLLPSLPSGAAARLEKIRLAVERGLARLGSSDNSASNSSDDTGEHEPLPQASR
jgi:hypothetical protein